MNFAKRNYLTLFFDFIAVIVPTCSPRERQCHNSSVCIEDSRFCDGKKDCPDGSDEGIGCAIMACNADNGGCSQLCNALPEGKQIYARRGGGGGREGNSTKFNTGRLRPKV